VVVEALRAGRVRRVLLAEGIHDAHFESDLRALATAAGVTVETADRSHFRRIAGEEKSQGVAAELYPFSHADLDMLLDHTAAAGRQVLLLALDQIQDPRNLGSLIRSADAAGADGLVMTERRTAPLSGVVSKASSGAMFHIPIARAGSMAAAIARLKRAGVWVVGLDQSAHQSIYRCDLTAPTAIVVGGEGSGLRRLTAERTDLLASIPMRGHVESLNVGVAGAIALFEAVRQRGG
jgi:23S rRNA (guanosine2251-2'-O)-methyltransferase